ncbi:MFS transporter [Rhodococcus sp. LB1]|uniref:MFS transporter n=1 Tax=Rhodococcus sp. LB1 TaxID=1807499 RepID=UPI0018D2874F
MALLAFFFDTMDAAMLGHAVPALRAEWGLSISTIGFLSSTTFVGMMIGAVVGGRLADRVGRRPIILGSVVFYSVFSLATGLAPNVTSLAVFRALSGLGLQAMIGVRLVFVSEMYPKHLRGDIRLFNFVRAISMKSESRPAVCGRSGSVSGGPSSHDSGSRNRRASQPSRAGCTPRSAHW